MLLEQECVSMSNKSLRIVLFLPSRRRRERRAERFVRHPANYVHASAMHGNKLTLMYAPVGGRVRGTRVEEAMKKRKKTNDYASERERDAIVIYSNKLGLDALHGAVHHRPDAQSDDER